MRPARLFRLPASVAGQSARRLEDAVRRRCPISGLPITVQLRRDLRAVQGALVSGGSRGVAVHAGSFPRLRRIVLDEALLGRPGELVRIFVHEVFHFAWLRLGNRLRRSWEDVLLAERREGARGELGWSAALRKERLSAADAHGRTRRWREYACEGFCDTAAFLLGRRGRHSEFTLAHRYRRRREAWFGQLFLTGILI